MQWTRLVLVIFAAGFVTSMTDWFFAGDWIHKRFTYPEIWRKGETRAIALTSPLPFLTCALFICLLQHLHIRTLSEAMHLGVAIWLIGPLPLILTNAAFIKLHRVFVLSYVIGWLVKLSIAALAFGLFVAH